ncbi:MAG: hypothetical protein QM658_06050 [Gordonia sp. (in: high G+C Gram-positive bacteria)]
MMRSPSVRLAAVGVLTAGALLGTVATAPEASANVPGGRYRSTSELLGTTTRSYIAIHGTTLTDYGPLGPQRFRIVSTPRGGFVDAYGARYVLNRSPDGSYRGPVYLGQFVIGRTELRPTDD